MFRSAIWYLICLIGCIYGANSAPAAVIVLANLGDKPMSCTVSHPVSMKNVDQQIDLPGRTTRVVPVGREPEVAFVLNGKPTRYRLDPFASYYFAEVDGTQVFSGIELVAPLPKVDDVPVDAPAIKPWKLQVEVYVEDTDKRKVDVAIKAYTDRVKAASAILEKQMGMQLEVVGSGEWAHDTDSEEMSSNLSKFERSIKAKPGVLMLGFSSMKYVPKTTADGKPASAGPKEAPVYSVSRSPFAKHLLMRDTGLRTEADKLEVLIHEIGRKFGAVGTPDSRSVMRKTLGDGQAVFVKFPIQFDPLNAVIVNIWGEQFQAGTLKNWADLTKPNRERLLLLYKSLSQLGADDPRISSYITNLESAAELALAPSLPKVELPNTLPTIPNEIPKIVVPETAMPKKTELPTTTTETANKPKIEPTTPKVSMSDVTLPKLKTDSTSENKQKAVEQVITAIRKKALSIKNNLPASERPVGDNLTNEYVRAAAEMAASLPADVQAHAFLVGLGVGLDSGTTLLDNPILKSLVGASETKEHRTERINALGKPTIMSRNDFTLHFMISAALTELVGASGAEMAGVMKEMLDLPGNSGLSFKDLAADFAGVAFAKNIQADPSLLKKVTTTFTTKAVMPALNDLKEGLSPERFKADYGTMDDPRFQAILEEIRKRVKNLKY